MDFIKTIFSIKDLENLSGVKKQTIRAWERRYGLLNPERTKTNIRFYSSSSLVHLLNVAMLHKNGFRISDLAALSPAELATKCQDLMQKESLVDRFSINLKLAVFSFDKYQFHKAYMELNQDYTFSQIFIQYFMPILRDVGFLWQTGTINPAHEHFISSLMKQKVLIETEKLGILEEFNSNHRFVLFLPDNEMHDLGICFINYEIVRRGFHTIYLGPSVPVNSLKVFESPKDTKLVFISYFTVRPEERKMQAYLDRFQSEILDNSSSELWVVGRRAKIIDVSSLPESIRKFDSIEELISCVEPEFV